MIDRTQRTSINPDFASHENIVSSRGESSKIKKFFGAFEDRCLRGKGIDIGCGNDPIFQDVRRFDAQDGDAGKITAYIQEEFDYVYSSHCLEHMVDPVSALKEWWQLVRLRGHLYVVVPDEDSGERGVWPSAGNPDHKFTFTSWKKKSWSPASLNVVDLIKELPGAFLVRLAVLDWEDNYSLVFVLRKEVAEEDKRWPEMAKKLPRWCNIFTIFIPSRKKRRAFRGKCKAW